MTGRLIDADELIVMEYGGIKFVPKEFVDDAPTVDAIPVEWIKKYAEEHRSCIQEFRYMLVDWTREKEK